MREQKSECKIDHILRLISTLNQDEFEELADKMLERGFPDYWDRNAMPLDIDDRFGPIEQELLRAIRNRDLTDVYGELAEDKLLRRVWPKDAARILEGGTPAQIRRLRNRLSARTAKINEKLRELNEPWRIVSRRTGEGTQFCVAESEPDETPQDAW